LRSSHAFITARFLPSLPTPTNETLHTHTDTLARRQKETKEDITAAHEGKRKKASKQAKKKTERTIDSIEKKSKKQVTSFIGLFYSVVVVVVVVFDAFYQPQHITFLKHILHMWIAPVGMN
jgi:hypothetical protein